MGAGLGRLWANQGHYVMFSYSRRPENLQNLVQEIGSHARSGTLKRRFRISAGRIAEDHVSGNLLDLLHQLGATQFAAA